MFIALIFVILIPALAVVIGVARLGTPRPVGSAGVDASRPDDYIDRVRSEVLYQADFQRMHED